MNEYKIYYLIFLILFLLLICISFFKRFHLKFLNLFQNKIELSPEELKEIERRKTLYSRRYEQSRLEEKQKKTELAKYKYESAVRSWRKYHSLIDEKHIDELSGVAFERFLEKVFIQLSYSVSLTPTTGDQGVDLIIKKGDVSIAIQAKRQKNMIGNSAVQQIIAGKLFYGCSEGWIVTNSYFTKYSIELAEKDKSIKLIDRDKLSELCELAKINKNIPEFTWDDWNLLKERIRKSNKLFAKFFKCP